jgi:hypothetical protein
MTQRMTASKSIEVDVTTAATRLPEQVAALVTFQSLSTNTAASTIEILGISGETIDTVGITILPGEFAPSQWVTNLNQMAVKSSTGTQKLRVLIQR